MRGFTVWGAVIYLTLIGAAAVGRSPVLAQSISAASVDRLTLTLESETEESYQTLERRAEAAARAATQRLFDGDILVRTAVVTIVAENRGLSAPVLTLQATREQWRQLPDPQRWSTYYPTAQALLQLSPTPPLDAKDSTAPAIAPPPASAFEESLPTIPLPEQVPGTPAFPAQP